VYRRKGQNTGLLALREEVCETSWERCGHLEGSSGISLGELMEVSVPRRDEGVSRGGRQRKKLDAASPPCCCLDPKVEE